MAQHHALGAAGGAAGVEDAHQFLARGHRVRHRLAGGDQFLVVPRFGGAGIVVGINQVKRNGFCQFDAHRSERLVHDKRRGTAVAQRVLDLGVAPADVGGDDHSTCPGDAEIEFEIAVGVQHQHRDPVAALHAELKQSAGQPCDTLADFAPAAAALAVDGRDPLRVGLQHPAQPLGHVHKSLDAPLWLRS